MDTFEFLSVMQIHGFPRLMGVATHLDHLKENKQKKKMKKELRKRFEIEVPPESKLFFVKGMKKGLYDFRDIHNLSRFISVIIPRQLDFKKQHSHLLIDRIEQSEGKALVFGYVRGADLIENENQKQLLVSGLGMVEYTQIRRVHDPCPVGQKGQKRGLKKNEKILYAPQSNIGMAMFDETGDYVEIPDKHIVFTQKEGQDIEIEEHEGVQMMRNLQKGLEEDEEEEVELMEGVVLEEEQESIPIEEEENMEMGKLAMKVHQEYKETGMIEHDHAEIIDLNSIVYPSVTSTPRDHQKLEFSKNSMSYLHHSRDHKPIVDHKHSDFIEVILENCEDNSYFYPTDLREIDFYREHTKCRFVTGFQGNDSDAEDSEEEMDIEDDSSVDMEDYESDNEGLNIQKEKEIETMKTSNDRLTIKGSYIRIELSKIPPKIFKKFSEMPVIISQLATGETQMGFLMVKFKRHRFYRNLLKTNDPLIVSLNFNKYQTVPYFCRRDLGQRLRMLKYTPKHEFCLAVFYGNYVPAQTGVVAFQTISRFMIFLIYR